MLKILGVNANLIRDLIAKDISVRRENQTESQRIQLEFSPDVFARLKKIKKETDASSYAELVRNALRIYEWIAQQEKEGYEIGLVKDDTLIKTVKFVY